MASTSPRELFGADDELALASLLLADGDDDDVYDASLDAAVTVSDADADADASLALLTNLFDSTGCSSSFDKSSSFLSIAPPPQAPAAIATQQIHTSTATSAPPPAPAPAPSGAGSASCAQRRVASTSRQRQKAELEYLRTQVQELEQQLAALKRDASPGDTASSPSSSGSSPSSVIVSAWERIARNQMSAKQKAEAENLKLRALLEGQLKVARGLEKLLRKRPCASVRWSVARQGHDGELPTDGRCID
ncbi:hypothetical protein PINS_up012566 [Pythium insidiosum]|nr:hypothetical protein PINS_up012566 [Pythium insidiosum]